VIVSHKDQRTILEAAASERVMNGHHTSVADTLPGLSKTLADQHLSAGTRFPGRHTNAHIPEQLLWGYMTQIANGLKAIHYLGSCG
jgi:PAB-dependent poly(A)-specific ribonuclease subunit 3